MPRACVFVDGENFRYSILGLFPTFRKEDYLPQSAKWTELFDWIASKSAADVTRVRTYWYVIRTIDYFPWGFPDSHKEPDKLRQVLSKHPPYEQELNAIADDTARITRMSQLVTDLLAKRDRMGRRFEGWTKIQDGIAGRHNAVEFRRAGAIRCNLFDFGLGQEKAVDVKLAADLIFLKDIYDVAVIVSGDQDYVPAVELVKDYGKRVINVAFETRRGQLLPGGARRLNQATDWSISLKHSELASYLGLSSS